MPKYEYRTFFEGLIKFDESSTPKEKSENDFDKAKNKFGEAGWEVYQEEDVSKDPSIVVSEDGRRFKAKRVIE